MTLRVPIRVVWQKSECDAHTVVVNRHGAMILSPVRFADEAKLRVWNVESGESALFRVVWYGGEDLPHLYKLGIELLDDCPQFWGLEYEHLVAEAEL